MSYYGWPKLVALDEETDLEVSKCWFLVAQFSIPLKKPISHWLQMSENNNAFAWAAETLMVPTAKGLCTKSRNGMYYSALRPTTEEEEKQREPIHRERMKPWIEDFEGIWRGKLIPEMKNMFDPLKKADLRKLSITELEEYCRIYFITGFRRLMEIHHLTMYASFTAYKQFRQLCGELLGIDEQHPQFKKLMTAFPTIIYEVDRGLWRLADRANIYGLKPLFQAIPDNDTLLAKLEQSKEGRKWLEELHEFLNEHGWRVDGMLDVCVPSWVEKPALALPTIRGNIAKGEAFLVDREHGHLAKAREEAERDILSRVPEDKRDWFHKLMRTAQWAGTFNEEHTYYIELYYAALTRRLLMEIGRRGTQAGVLDDPDDINFLLPDEISRLLLNTETSAYRKIVQIRRKEFQEFQESALKNLKEELTIGDLDWGIANMHREPTMLVLGGAQEIKLELKADLYGTASTPGVAEGIARVLTSPTQLSQLVAGEILVVPTSNPAWNPAFNFVSGVVTDSGGALCHAIIVAREYGISCVAGTREATTKIKTGDRIRVDGDNNAVYILKREP
jgi:phosphohistidine swiveling domain-containing protein